MASYLTQAVNKIFAAHKQQRPEILGYRSFDALFENFNGDQMVKGIVERYEKDPQFKEAVDYCKRYIPIEDWIKLYYQKHSRSLF